RVLRYIPSASLLYSYIIPCTPVLLLSSLSHFFCNGQPATEIYTLSLHDALPILSKPQSLLTYAATVQAGGFFNGERIRVTAEAAYRFQPYVRIGISSTYNHIILPEPMESRELWLVGPLLDVTMTNKLFFTAFAQYNEQMDNFNLNTRFQWLFMPASDIFIV